MPNSSSNENVYYSLADLNDALTKTPYEVPFYYKNSQKSYKIVKSWKSFKKNYSINNKNNGCAEFIRENQPTKMYFDIDFYAEEGDNTMLKNVIEFLIYTIKDIYKIDITEEQLTILEANGISKSKSCYKHSYHIIVNNDRYCLCNKKNK